MNEERGAIGMEVMGFAVSSTKEHCGRKTAVIGMRIRSFG
jgi:hypothetical protein